MSVSHVKTPALLPPSLWRWSLALVLLCGVGLSEAASRLAGFYSGSSSSAHSSTFSLLGHGEPLAVAKRVSCSDDSRSDSDEKPPALTALLQPTSRLPVLASVSDATAFYSFSKTHCFISLRTPRAPPLLT